VVYRKQWLGSEEAAHFAPGDRPARIEVGGLRLGLAICRDTGIAQHAADTAALGIDAYLAGIVHGEDELGVHDERARRIATTHGVWVAIASAAGHAGRGYERAAGRSGIWSPAGAVVCQVEGEVDAIARATLTRA
jgi:predicted amidohydrolase